jgi:hypothetical protein
VKLRATENCHACCPAPLHVEACDNADAERLVKGAKRVFAYVEVWEFARRSVVIPKKQALTLLTESPRQKPPKVSAMFTGAHTSVFMG